MAKVGELFISLRASTASFSKDLKNSTRITSKSAKQMEAAFKKVGLALIALGSAAVIGLGALVKGSIDAADRMAKMGRELGISTEALSVFKREAELGGTDLETFSTGLARLARNLSDARNGLMVAQRAFGDLGIKVLDSSGNLRDLQGVTLEVAEKFSLMKDGSRKTARAMELMGRGGVALINTFNTLGKKGFAVATREAERFGEIIDTKTAAAAEEFNDNLRDLRAAVEGLGNSVAAALLPSFVSLTENFVKFVTEGDKIKNIAKEIAVSFLALALSINDMKTRLNTTTGVVGNATDVFLEFLRAPVTGLDPVRAAWKKLTDDAEVSALTGEDVARRLVDAFFNLSQNIKPPAKQVEQTINGIKEQFDELIKKNKDLSQHALKPVIFDFDELKLSTQELREAQEKQNAATAEQTEFLRAHGVELSRTIGLTKEATNIGETFTSSLSSGLQGLIVRGGKFSDVLKRIAQDLVAMLARLAILRLIGGIVGAFIGGAGGSGGGTASSGSTGSFPLFRHGGTLRAGQVGIVGEGGEPELIAAGVTSQIMPLSKLGGTTIIINAQGAGPGVGAEIRRALRQATKETAALARSQVRENALRTP